MLITKEYIYSLLSTTPICVYALFAFIVVILSAVIICKRGVKKGLRVSSLLLLIAYSTIVICTTVIFREEREQLGVWRPLFWSYYILESAKHQIIEENIMNIVAFIPLGSFLAICSEKIKWKHAVLFSISLSSLIEVLQLSLKRGTFEFDDVFHNTLGCLIGYYIVRAVLVFYHDYVAGKSKEQEL